MTKKRDLNIDFLRAFSIIAIFLIHILTNTQNNILFVMFHYLHFVVVTLVFCSGASLAYSKNSFDNFSDVISFYKKRLLRLYLPWAIYLVVIHFPLNYIFSLLIGQPFRYSLDTLLLSLLTFGVSGGIPYGWILLVVFITSLYYPLFIYLTKRLSDNMVFLSLLFIVAITHFFKQVPDILYYFLPVHYLLAFYLGIRYTKNKTRIMHYAGAFLVLHILFGIIMVLVQNKELLTWNTKFVPDMYFLSLSLSLTYFLVILANRIRLFPVLKGTILFFSMNSMWLYLWHIVLLGAVNLLFNSLYFLPEIIGWAARFCTLVLLTSIVVIVQTAVLRKIKQY